MSTRTLSDEDIVEIRGLYYLDNISQSDLSEDYGVSQVVISHVINGKTYEGVDFAPIKGKHYEQDGYNK